MGVWVLSTILRLGARPALPVEFTRRAFMNGRIDLSQAEAVAALISSRSRASARASLGLLEGRFSSSISSLREELVRIAGLLELEMDFSEEGIDLVTNTEIERRLTGVRSVVDRLGRSYHSGRMIREGVSVVLAGRPNAGKSSLFNALLMADRAIVTAAPGTTRDTIEEEIEIEGVLFRLTDTAGVRESRDEAEFPSRVSLRATSGQVHAAGLSPAGTLPLQAATLRFHRFRQDTGPSGGRRAGQVGDKP